MLYGENTKHRVAYIKRLCHVSRMRIMPYSIAQCVYYCGVCLHMLLRVGSQIEANCKIVFCGVGLYGRLVARIDFNERFYCISSCALLCESVNVN